MEKNLYKQIPVGKVMTHGQILRPEWLDMQWLPDKKG
jgi:hypothetical protein